MSKKILPSWLNNRDNISNNIDPEKIIVWCPFWHDLKIFSKNVEKLNSDEISESLDKIISNKTIHRKEDIINVFNTEKKLRHNTYFDIFQTLCDVVYPEYSNQLQSIQKINNDFFIKVLNVDTKILDDEIMNSIDDIVQKNIDKFKYLKTDMKNFELIQNHWYRKIWKWRWKNLYESTILWFDQLIYSMRMYFFYIINNFESYDMWLNQKKLNIPKHLYFWAKTSQFYSYIINDVTLNDIVSKNWLKDIYDQNTITWYSTEVENLLKENIEKVWYWDFYKNQFSKYDDLSNLVMPLEENYPCPAIWFFSQMRGICLSIMIEKYWEPSDFIYKK